MPITVKPLPYAEAALAPHMSQETLQYHYGKHHQTYAKNLNGFIEGTSNADQSLEDLITGNASASGNVKIFNNAAQIWNHSFFWDSMKPDGGGEPEGVIAARIATDFGGYDKFREQFTAAATGQFGSGWGWLVEDGDKLAIIATPNADLPMAHGKKALLTCDVWEHAYYIDFRNDRGKFVQVFLDQLVDWSAVNARLAG